MFSFYFAYSSILFFYILTKYLFIIDVQLKKRNKNNVYFIKVFLHVLI